MELIESAPFAPGCCVLGGGHKDLVDFQRAMPIIPDGYRMYVSQQLIADAARTMGFRSPEELTPMRRELEALRERCAYLEAVEETLENLRKAVRTTLNNGAVVDRRSGATKLRLAPKQARAEVEV